MPTLSSIIDKFLRRDTLTSGEKSDICGDLGAVVASGSQTIAGIKTFTSVPRSTGSLSGSNNDLINVGHLTDLAALKSALVFSADSDDNGTPVATTTIKKSQASCGWYVRSSTAMSATSKCVIAITGTQAAWAGSPSIVGSDSYSLFGEFIIQRGGNTSFSTRIQRFFLVGKGTEMGAVSAGADITTGGSPPPACTVSVTNGATPTLQITATNDASSSTALSFSINQF